MAHRDPPPQQYASLPLLPWHSNLQCASPTSVPWQFNPVFPISNLGATPPKVSTPFRHLVAFTFTFYSFRHHHAPSPSPTLLAHTPLKSNATHPMAWFDNHHTWFGHGLKQLFQACAPYLHCTHSRLPKYLAMYFRSFPTVFAQISATSIKTL
jgi:hypothetical protein